jgi:hypothetical protein
MMIKNKLQQALTAAMKARDVNTRRTLRLVMATIKLAEVEQRGEIDDSRILSILQKEVKMREEAIAEAQQADRDDLVDMAYKEIEILNQFLPKQMDEEELISLAKSTIEKIGASSPAEMGAVMKHLMPKLEGRASGQDASRIVRDLLQS